MRSGPCHRETVGNIKPSESVDYLSNWFYAMAAGVAAVEVDEDDGAGPRWDPGGVCCLQTGHQRQQLQKINILLLWKLVQRSMKKIDPYRATLACWWPFLS